VERDDPAYLDMLGALVAMSEQAGRLEGLVEALRAAGLVDDHRPPVLPVLPLHPSSSSSSAATAATAAAPVEHRAPSEQPVPCACCEEDKAFVDLVQCRHGHLFCGGCLEQCVRPPAPTYPQTQPHKHARDPAHTPARAGHERTHGGWTHR
jgi:hypothetical protein